jgi:RHS repeat-associated protein
VKPRNSGGPMNETNWIRTFYALDASGNTIATYEHHFGDNAEGTEGYEYVQVVSCRELFISGASRLGVQNENMLMASQELDLVLNGLEIDWVNTDVLTPVETEIDFDYPVVMKGDRGFEMSNHLGNVMVSVSDMRAAIDFDSDEVIDYYEAFVLTATDYYAYGMSMPERITNAGAYRYGYNGMEREETWNAVVGDYYTTEFRMLDVRIGRWLSLDPLAAQFPWQSPFISMDGNPIGLNDPMGASAGGPGDPPTHTVAAGDSPCSIAKLYGITTWELAKWNEGNQEGGGHFNSIAGKENNWQGYFAKKSGEWKLKPGDVLNVGPAGGPSENRGEEPATSTSDSIVNSTPSSNVPKSAIDLWYAGEGSALAAWWEGDMSTGFLLSEWGSQADEWARGWGEPFGRFLGECHPGVSLYCAFTGSDTEGNEVGTGGRVLMAADAFIPGKIPGASKVDDLVGVAPKLLPQFSTKTIDEAVELVFSDPNKVHHLFQDKHKFTNLVANLGGDRATVKAVLEGANGKLPASGIFDNVAVDIHGVTVYVSGNVINGMPRIGTMYIK